MASIAIRRPLVNWGRLWSGLVAWFRSLVTPATEPYEPWSGDYSDVLPDYQRDDYVGA